VTAGTCLPMTTTWNVLDSWVLFRQKVLTRIATQVPSISSPGCLWTRPSVTTVLAPNTPKVNVFSWGSSGSQTQTAAFAALVIRLRRLVGSPHTLPLLGAPKPT
jgi:hypothetical protein